MTIEREYTEGRTTFLSADVDHYSEEKGQPTTSLPVFYNPRMQLNRDISVVFLSTYLKEHRIDLMCEPLTGSGVRTLRYLNECEGDFNAVMFDANPQAVDTASRNIERLRLEDRAKVMRGDAKLLLLTESREERFDYVDIDPFGSPTPYLSAAVQSLSPKHGLLAVTATDMPVLCGVYPKVSLRKYGGFSMRSPFVHELAVRLLLGQVFRVTGANDSSMTPLTVLSTDHYVRAWTVVSADKKKANRQAEKYGIIRFCPKCMSTQTLPLSKQREAFVHVGKCTGKYREAGPLWIGEIFNGEFNQEALNVLKSTKGNLHKKVPDVLEKMVKEAELMDYPFVDLHALCDLHSLSPPRNTEVMTELEKRGYRVSPTHFKSTAIRTDAPIDEVRTAIEKILGR